MRVGRLRSMEAAATKRPQPSHQRDLRLQSLHPELIGLKNHRCLSCFTQSLGNRPLASVFGLPHRMLFIVFAVEESPMNNDIPEFVFKAIYFLVAAAVIKLIGKGRLRKRPEHVAHIVVHPLSTALMGIAWSALWWTCTAIASTSPSEPSWVIFAGFGFGMPGLLLILSFFISKYELNTQGLTYRRIFGQRGTVLWSDVVRVWYSTMRMSFVLDIRDGSRVHISALMLGLPKFADMALSNVSPFAIDETIRATLEATAAGDLPGLV